MKKKKLGSRLTLKKMTVAHLNAGHILGGDVRTNTCICPPNTYAPNCTLGVCVQPATVADTCASCICPPPTYDVQSCGCQGS